MKRKILTLRQIYKEGEARLLEAELSEAGLDAWLLLSYVTGLSRAAYYGNPDKELEEADAARYMACIEMRRKRVPLQHITGEQEFMGYPFRVNEHVLIPRQDTEILVEEVLKVIRPGIRVLDMCTGSGCILISLLKTACERMGIMDLCGTGTDISGPALLVAEENRETLLPDLKINFVQGDLFENVIGRYDIIVSNPPYIPTKVIDGLQEEVRLHDPYIALDGKEDGLYFYRRITEESCSFIKNGGFLAFEIGWEQAAAVVPLMESAGYTDVCVKKDLSGLDRVVAGRYNKE